MPDRAEIVPESELDPETVRRLCGEITDGAVSAIVASRASLADLEAAVAWVDGASDAMGEARRPIVGAVAMLYDLLMAERSDDER
jgi:hypothetical protein